MIDDAARVRSLLILVLAASCGRESAATSQWCKTYVDELRTRAAGNVEWMTKDERLRQRGVEELLAMVGSVPAINVAFEVCSDASGDSPTHHEKRRLRVSDLQAQISKTVLLHNNAALDAAQAKQLGLLVEQLANAYTDPAP